MNKLSSSSYDISIVQDEGEQVYQYIPTNMLATEFQMGDLFIQSRFLRKHHKMISPSKLIFKYESATLLSEIPKITDQILFRKIACQLLEAVYELHRHQNIGRCFNQNNILWNKETQELSLMEFGLAPQLQFSPPELFKCSCYGIEIDVFLIGRVLYFLYFKSDIKLNANNLNQEHQRVKNNLDSIQDDFIQQLLKRLLHFQMADRITLRNLAKKLSFKEEIINFYSGNQFQQLKLLMDQKIFFRETRQQHQVYEVSYIMQYEDLKFEENLYSPARTNNKIKIVEIHNNDLDKLYSEIQFSSQKFDCFAEIIGSLQAFENLNLPLIPLSILAVKLGQIFFRKQFIKALQNDDFKYFKSTNLEWDVFKVQRKKFIDDKLLSLTKSCSNIELNFNKPELFKQIETHIKSSNEENKQDLLKWFQQITKSNLDSGDLNFLDPFRKILIAMLILVNENMDFTQTIAKAYTLRIELLLGAFPDILFSQNLQCYNQIKQSQNNQPLTQLSEIKTFIEKGVDIQEFVEKIQSELASMPALGEVMKFFEQQGL